MPASSITARFNFSVLFLQIGEVVGRRLLLTLRSSPLCPCVCLLCLKLLQRPASSVKSPPALREIPTLLGFKAGTRCHIPFSFLVDLLAICVPILLFSDLGYWRQDSCRDEDVLSGGSLFYFQFCVLPLTTSDLLTCRSHSSHTKRQDEDFMDVIQAYVLFDSSLHRRKFQR